tara:strand:- start:3273 stop:3563 length:291 start_codon:yes stop_codon:yes gene_type:complete
MKMDTQGMSGPADPNYKGPKQVYKPMEIHPMRLFTPDMVKELKILINEVLDEREHKKKMQGPYDLYDEIDDLKPSYFDTEHFKHYLDEPEPPYNGR